MSRQYAKRTKSTKSKTYQDYLDMRQELVDKGYSIKDQMSEVSFNNYYDRLKRARKTGELASSPWQELKRRTKYVWSSKQAKYLADAATIKEGRKVTQKEIKQYAQSQIGSLIEFIESNKESGLFGGDYE